MGTDPTRTRGKLSFSDEPAPAFESAAGLSVWPSASPDPLVLVSNSARLSNKASSVLTSAMSSEKPRMPTSERISDASHFGDDGDLDGSVDEAGWGSPLPVGAELAVAPSSALVTDEFGIEREPYS